MKIGLSYSRCVRDIVEGKVDIADVLVVIARTDFDPRDDKQWEGIWQGYHTRSGWSNPEWAHYPPEDEDRFDKMRERQKEGLFSQGRFFNSAAAITLATSIETETWTNPKVFLNTVSGLPVPGPLISVGLEAPFNIADHIIGDLTNDPSAYYKKDVGPYSFQKQDGQKWKADIAKLFGFTGSAIDPAKAMKSQEDIRKGLFR